jgi:hypothetical protein
MEKKVEINKKMIAEELYLDEKIMVMSASKLSMYCPNAGVSTKKVTQYTYLLTYLLMWLYNQYLVKACWRRCLPVLSTVRPISDLSGQAITVHPIRRPEFRSSLLSPSIGFGSE